MNVFGLCYWMNTFDDDDEPHTQRKNNASLGTLKRGYSDVPISLPPFLFSQPGGGCEYCITCRSGTRSTYRAFSGFGRG